MLNKNTNFTDLKLTIVDQLYVEENGMFDVLTVWVDTEGRLFWASDCGYLVLSEPHAGLNVFDLQEIETEYEDVVGDSFAETLDAFGIEGYSSRKRIDNVVKKINFRGCIEGMQNTFPDERYHKVQPKEGFIEEIYSFLQK